MTTAQHLAIAITAGHSALDDGSSVDTLASRAATAAHHALLAQRCGKCKGFGRSGTPIMEKPDGGDVPTATVRAGLRGQHERRPARATGGVSGTG